MKGPRRRRERRDTRGVRALRRVGHERRPLRLQHGVAPAGSREHRAIGTRRTRASSAAPPRVEAQVDEPSRLDGVARLPGREGELQQTLGEHPVVLEGGRRARHPGRRGGAQQSPLRRDVLGEQQVGRSACGGDPLGVVESPPRLSQCGDGEAVPAGEDLVVDGRRLVPGPPGRVEQVVAALDAAAVDRALAVLRRPEAAARGAQPLSLIHISEPTRRQARYRMPSS
ncbi:hypothetical protein FRIG_14145, partial [Frigoribacterium faeni]|uniref:hypothetical protein n=1 Tax=Frigoribacterium faeni TaxID=145483 RepID=UPI001FADB032